MEVRLAPEGDGCGCAMNQDRGRQTPGHRLFLTRVSGPELLRFSVLGRNRRGNYQHVAHEEA
jgi:hypothetical protein